MINYISYFLFFLGNFILILFLDNTIAYNFLSIYSVSGLVIGPIIFLYFSNLRKSLKNSKLLVVLLNFSLFFLHDSFSLLIIIYTLNLFYADFLSSQSNNGKANFYFKISFFVSVIPFSLNIIELYEILVLRIFICSILILFFYLREYSYEKLSIKSPFKYLILTNLVYFGSLFFITLVIKGFLLKIIYIFFQICFSTILKLYDLRLRGIIKNQKFNIYSKFIYFILILLPIIFLFIDISKIIIVIYYLNIFILYLIKKYLIN